MKTKIFHKYVVTLLFSILLFATGIKIHSALTAPQVSDWNYHQLQKIDHSKRNFSFAVFGDNKNSVKTFENLISKLNNDDVLFAIDDGDLVWDGEREKFRFFLNQVKGLNKPLLTVFGNHEAKGNGRDAYYNLFGQFYYSYFIGNSYFIVLDDSNEKNLDDAQFAWLKNELKKSQKYKYRFVFMHVPLYDPQNNSTTILAHALKDKIFAKKLNDLFDENKVTMLFCSHIHGYFRGKWGKTPYIITGGGGAELMGTDPKHYFYHYIKVNVNDNSVHYDVVKLKSPDFELLDRWTHDAWIYIYAFFAVHFIDALLVITLIYLSVYIIFIKKKWLVFNLKRDKR